MADFAGSPHAAHYGQGRGTTGILASATEIPAEMREACGAIVAGRHGTLAMHGVDMGAVNLYAAEGTVAPHVDDVFWQPDSPVTMGLVLLNEGAHCLRTEDGIFPLEEGTVYRIDPTRLHGTCLADGTASPTGRLAFVTCDYDGAVDPEQTPAEFLDWIMDSVRERLDLAEVSRSPGR